MTSQVRTVHLQVFLVWVVLLFVSCGLIWGRKQRTSQVECWVRLQLSDCHLENGLNTLWDMVLVPSSFQCPLVCPKASSMSSGLQDLFVLWETGTEQKGRTNALPYTFLKSWVDCTILRLPPVQLVLSIPTIQHSTNWHV